MGAIVLASGLESVPEADGSSRVSDRTREVWTRDEWRRFNRVCKEVKGHGDALLLQCGATLCRDRAIALVADPSAERGAVLRCGCTDRVFSRA